MARKKRGIPSIQKVSSEIENLQSIIDENRIIKDVSDGVSVAVATALSKVVIDSNAKTGTQIANDIVRAAQEAVESVLVEIDVSSINEDKLALSVERALATGMARMVESLDERTSAMVTSAMVNQSTATETHADKQDRKKNTESLEKIADNTKRSADNTEDPLTSKNEKADKSGGLLSGILGSLGGGAIFAGGKIKGLAKLGLRAAGPLAIIASLASFMEGFFKATDIVGKDQVSSIERLGAGSANLITDVLNIVTTIANFFLPENWKIERFTPQSVYKWLSTKLAIVFDFGSTVLSFIDTNFIEPIRRSIGRALSSYKEDGSLWNSIIVLLGSLVYEGGMNIMKGVSSIHTFIGEKITELFDYVIDVFDLGSISTRVKDSFGRFYTWIDENIISLPSKVLAWATSKIPSGLKSFLGINDGDPKPETLKNPKAFGKSAGVTIIDLIRRAISDDSLTGQSNHKSGGNSRLTHTATNAWKSDGSYQIGSITAQSESRGDGGTINNYKSKGFGDHGGASYGKFQFASYLGADGRETKAGASKNSPLMSFINSSRWASEFKGLVPGTDKFDKKWKEIASRDKEEFENAQLNMMMRSHFDPAHSHLMAKGIMLKDRGDAVQEMIFSTATQYGPSSSIIPNALKGKNYANMSDAEIIETVQDYKMRTVDSYFKSSNENVRGGVRNRISNERNQLASMARAPSEVVASAAISSNDLSAESNSGTGGEIAAMNQSDRIIEKKKEVMASEGLVTSPNVQTHQPISNTTVLNNIQTGNQQSILISARPERDYSRSGGRQRNMV